MGRRGPRLHDGSWASCLVRGNSRWFLAREWSYLRRLDASQALPQCELHLIPGANLDAAEGAPEHKHVLAIHCSCGVAGNVAPPPLGVKALHGPVIDPLLREGGLGGASGAAPGAADRGRGATRPEGGGIPRG
eukprot:6409666-Alexandrium_andersonii.AAC.1